MRFTDSSWQASNVKHTAGEVVRRYLIPYSDGGQVETLSDQVQSLRNLVSHLVQILYDSRSLNTEDIENLASCKRADG